ncbi:MAG TPA: PEP-CTERM sorting domain-containing protein [Roseateles sp.]
MKPIRPHRLALAVASLLLTLAAPSGRADVVVTGPWWSNPGVAAPLNGPHLDRPDTWFWFGAGGVGSFSALAGSQVNLAGFSLGAGGNGVGTGLLDGAGTVMRIAPPAGQTRLAVGDWGTGALTVSGGALLDAATGAAACANTFCGAFIGQYAGDTARLTITGAGSEARFISSLDIGNSSVSRPAIEGWTAGEINGTTRARVEVLAGGRLVAENVVAANGNPPGGSQGGGERSFVDLVVSGAGSTWLVTGQRDSGGTAGLRLGQSFGSTVAMDVNQGGLLWGDNPGQSVHFALGHGGGNVAMAVDGAGSEARLSGRWTGLWVGYHDSASSNQLTVANGGALRFEASEHAWLRVGDTRGSNLIRVSGGGSITGMNDLRVGGFWGGTGTLEVSGAGSRVTGANSAATLNLGAEFGTTGENRLLLSDGGLVQMGRLAVGVDSPSQNRVLLSGSGTRLELNGTNNERLYVGNGSITVSGGAMLDARADEANCAGGVWCATKIGTVAGSQGSLTVDGAGSVGRFTGHFQVGVTDLATQAADGWSRGTPGGQTLASVKVLNGGLVQTDHVTMALGTFSAGATGTESAIVDFSVQGAGSRFEVLGRDGLGSYLQTVTWNAQNSSANLAVLDGGVLALQAHEGGSALMSLSNLAGSTRMQVRGAGSTLSFAANEVGRTSLQLARSAGSFADIAVSQGGLITGNEYLSIGTSPGAVGTVSISGAGSAYVSGGGIAYTSVGYTGGQGSLAVTDGGLLQMQSGQSALRVGIGSRDGVAANGLLRIAGGTVNVVGRRDASHALGIGMGFMQVGNDAQGSVQVSNGGQLLISSDGDAQASNGWLGSGLTVGKSNAAVGSGQLLVSGPGSRVDTVGTNPFVTIGTGSQASGALRITHGGVVATTLMGVGDLGAMGTVGVDAATLRLDGAWRSGVTIGASLALGSGGGTGLMTLANGSQLLIHADGAERGSLALGGSWFSPGGVGVLQAAGSAISVTGAGGGQVVVGATAGGIGTLSLNGGSTLVTDYLGVGAFDGADSGGVGTLIVNGTSTLTAATIEIGARGYVGGTGTLIGNVINRGVFSPGNSPGTLHVQGSFVNQAGGRLVLEVESDGQGGFVTDQLVFGAGGALDLGELQIEFRFLGATDPNAFQASGGFQIDSFLSQAGTPLDHALLDGVSYAASSSAYQFTSFTFSADGGAVFAAQPVPEPGTWVLFALGLGVTGWLQKRRKR